MGETKVSRSVIEAVATTEEAVVRTLPRSLALIVSDLELTGSKLVALSEIEHLARRHGLRSRPGQLAARLRERGWLLDTGRRGVYEFAPGAHAGPYGHGDPFVRIRAVLLARPELLVRVALNSALWLHGLAERAPDRHVVALPTRQHAPAALTRSSRVVHFDAHRAPAMLDELPVEAPATLLVHLATHPNSVRDWFSVGEALADLVERVTATEVAEELTSRPAAVGARLGYLLQAVAPDLVAELDLQPGHGAVWFGPRRPTKRFDSRWNVADTLLPYDPAQPPDTMAR